MNKKCKQCAAIVPLYRWRDHMRHYHGGTALRPFGKSAEEIDASVNNYIELHAAEWSAPRERPICEFCGVPCLTVTACRQRRDRLRQAAELARRAALEVLADALA